MRPLAARSGVEERLRHVEDAVEVERDDVVPVLRHRLRVRGEGVAAGDAGIVDEDRDLPDLVGDLPGERKAVVTLGHIERKALGLAAGLADLLRGLRDRVGVDVEQHHLRALAGVAGAIARPMPDPAPVTTAMWFASNAMTISSRIRFEVS